MRKVLKIFGGIALVSIAAIYLYGCGQCGAKAKTTNKKEVVAYVNKDPIYRSDLDKEMALRARTDPALTVTPDTERENLDMIIDRKLIIQYAMKKGLAREERFVNTIRNIWEQALIRDCIDYKKKEFQDYLFATEDEIKKYYDNISWRITFKVLRERDKRKAQEAYNRFLKTKDTEGWDTIGPAGYDDIYSVFLLDAFTMEEGQAKIFEEAPYYYIVEVSKREKAEPPPFDSVKAELKERVAAMKEKRLFTDWLRDVRKKTRIKIEEKNL